MHGMPRRDKVTLGAVIAACADARHWEIGLTMRLG